jgi:hypothetical protein
MILPKNYHRFITEEYSGLYREVIKYLKLIKIKSKVKDLTGFKYDYSISGIQDYILKIDAPRVSSKAFALKLVCNFLFRKMKQTYRNMSYIKVTLLVPSRILKISYNL